MVFSDSSAFEFSPSQVVQKGPEEHTPSKINVEPEHDGLEDDLPFPGVYSQVSC